MEQALFEARKDTGNALKGLVVTAKVSLLERFKEAASDGREAARSQQVLAACARMKPELALQAPMRIPRYFGHKAWSCGQTADASFFLQTRLVAVCRWIRRRTAGEFAWWSTKSLNEIVMQPGVMPW